MTRDHDMKRAVRARMRATGERYTVARSALVAPDRSDAPKSETSLSQGGTMPVVHIRMLDELDERGFAVLRSFATADEVARMTVVVDEVISTTLAEKQAEEDRRRHAGETGPIDVWYPGQPGGIYADLTDHADVAWILTHPRLLELAGAVKAGAPKMRKVVPGRRCQGMATKASIPMRTARLLRLARGTWPGSSSSCRHIAPKPAHCGRSPARIGTPLSSPTGRDRLCHRTPTKSTSKRTRETSSSTQPTCGSRARSTVVSNRPGACSSNSRSARRRRMAPTDFSMR